MEYGIRLGLQEISRYNWNDDTLHDIALILSEIAKANYSKEKVQSLMAKLPEKKICFTFNSTDWEDLL